MKWTACEILYCGKEALLRKDTGRNLNVHKTFRRRPGCLLNVLCTFNLRPVSMGEFTQKNSSSPEKVDVTLKVAPLEKLLF